MRGAAQVPANLVMDPAFGAAPEEAFAEAVLTTNDQLHASAVDDAMSGTTAVAALVRGRALHVANVGDSRAVLAERGPGGRAVAVPLSFDHTPFRRGPTLGCLVAALGDERACLHTHTALAHSACQLPGLPRKADAAAQEGRVRAGEEVRHADTHAGPDRGHKGAFCY